MGEVIDLNQERIKRGKHEGISLAYDEISLGYTNEGYTSDRADALQHFMSEPKLTGKNLVEYDLTKDEIEQEAMDIVGLLLDFIDSLRRKG